MSTSGTVTFNPEQSDLIEDAASLAGTELRTGYDLRMARFALNLLLQGWANRGFNLWTVTNDTISLTNGTASYNLPTDTVDVIDVAVRTGTGTSQSDITIRRIGVQQYLGIPNKTTPGRPVQYYVSRPIGTPTITVWPVPDLDSTYTLNFYYMRRMEDAGTTASLTFDTPVRFIPALVAGLAYQIALRKPELAERAASLKAIYDEEWELASGEDREKVTTRWVPRVRL